MLRNKQEAEKQLKVMSGSNEEENPLSVLEKSLCYVLVDKALLNCLLILDKALMEGKLTDRELNLQFNTVSSEQKLVSEFSQALNDKRQFVELSDELRRKEMLVDKMRTQIRELSSEKLRLESENKSLEEKCRLWQLKSEDEELRNSVIDSDRKRLKEKVLFLEESMNGLQSSTQHLRRQLQTLEQKDDVSRQENKLLKKKLQNYSEEMKQDAGRRHEETGSKQTNSPTTSGEINSRNMQADNIDTLVKENEELHSKVETLATDDYELRENFATLSHAHNEAIQLKDEEIQVLKEQKRTLEDDLDTRLTEIVLLKAQVVELQRNLSNAQKSSDNQGTCDIPSGLQVESSVALNEALVDKDLQQIKELSRRVKTSEERVEEYTALLDELSKRKDILVSTLEMVGAVTVIKNECDVPDGYTEAIDGVLRSQSSLIEKGKLLYKYITSYPGSEAPTSI